MNTACADGSSKVLEGVGLIGWRHGTACVCFPGALASGMRFLGEDVSDDDLMGLTGGAFFQYWLPPWAPSNCDLTLIGEEPSRRAFYALGYQYTWVSDMDRELPETFYRERIRQSIDRGVPVLADGVVGPPEICLVAGYERGGEVLVGTSYFHEGEGYFRAEGWRPNTYGLILIGERVSRPSPEEYLASVLDWAIRLARVPEFDALMAAGEPSARHSSGLAAYDALADALEQDAEFENVDSEGWFNRAAAIGNDGVYLLRGKRESAARFLDREADRGLPGADHLRRAADLYRREAEVAGKAGELAIHTMMSHEEMAAKLTRSNRLELARRVREARALDEQAVECLETALAVLAGR